MEISEVLSFMKLAYSIQAHKSYSKDWLVKGRIKVKLMNINGTLINDEIPNSKIFFIKKKKKFY